MLEFATPDGPVRVAATALTIAGWTGRDAAAVQHHIDELAAIGVPAPSTVPLFYRAAVQQLTQGSCIEVMGSETSGEVEPVLICVGGRLLLTVGSDHTDRALEAHSVALSKQIAAKPIGRSAVWLDTIEDPDALRLSSFSGEAPGQLDAYQDGSFAKTRPLRALVEGAIESGAGFADGAVMFCGTVPTLSGAVKPARYFKGMVSDGDRLSLSLSYETVPLPIMS
ncbi:MAG: DUF2848 family protein [Pseudomonadota bacterium]